MAIVCIPRTKSFEDTAKRLNISEAELERIAFRYMNQEGGTDFPSDDYIKSEYNVVNIVSKDLLEKATKLVEQKFTNIKGDQITVLNTYEEALKYFNKNAVKIKPLNDSTYELIVGIPQDTEGYTQEMRDIIANAPRDNNNKLLAPNNEPTNLNERQWALVRTKAFKNWFGDWENDLKDASKVVDKNGEPLVVYSGRPYKGTVDFTNTLKSDRNRTNLTNILKKGIYFTDKKYVAEQYSGSKRFINSLDKELSKYGVGEDGSLFGNKEEFLKMFPEVSSEHYNELESRYNEVVNAEWNPTGEFIPEIEKIEGEVVEAFLNLKVPFTKNLNGNSITHLTKNDRIAANNSEGVILENVNESTYGLGLNDIVTDYIIFKSNQIKSASDNITFQNDINNIYFHRNQTNELEKRIKKLEDDLIKAETLKEMNKLVFQFNNWMATNINIELKTAHDKYTGIRYTDSYAAIQNLININKPASLEEIINLFNKLQSKFPSSSFRVIQISKEELTQATNNNWTRCFIQPVKGGYDIYVDKNNLPSYTQLAEEMLHPLVATIQTQNPELFKNFLNECLNNKDLTIKSIIGAIKHNYIKQGNDIINNEIVTQVLAYKLKNIDKQQQTSTFKRVIKALVDLLNRVGFKLPSFATNAFRLDHLAYMLKFENIEFNVRNALTNRMGHIENENQTNVPIETTSDTSDFQAIEFEDIDITPINENQDDKLTALPNITKKEVQKVAEETEVSNISLTTVEEVESRIGIVNKTDTNVTIQVTPQEIKLDGGIFNAVSYDIPNTVYSANYKLIVNRLTEIIEGPKGSYEKEIDITDGRFDEQIDIWLESFPISSRVDINNFKDSIGYNLLYLIDRMLDRNWYASDYKLVKVGEKDKQYIKEGKFKHVKWNDDYHLAYIPVEFTYGLKDEEIKLMSQRDKLVNNPIFTASQLRSYSKGTIYQLSHIITQLNSASNAYSYYFTNDQSDKTKYFDREYDSNSKKDFTKMSRINVIRTLGMAKLLDLVKNKYFKINTTDTLTIIKKKKLIQSYWQSFVDMGYDTLIGLEEISLNGYTDVKDTIDDTLDNQTTQEIQEIFGDTIEHWQVGFRQVSAFNSLSQMIKRFMDTLYQIGKEGNIVKDDLHFEQHVNAQEAVAKILQWSQGADSIDEKDETGKYKSNSIIAMLKEHQNSNSWLTQVIEKLEGKKDDKGNIIEAADEQFKSQFFSNFKKYFQKYTITFKDPKTGELKIKVINENTAGTILLQECKAKENSYFTSNFKLRNTDGSLNINNYGKLKTLQNSFDNIVKAASQKQNKLITTGVYNSVSDILLKDLFDIKQLHSYIKDILNILDITIPQDEVLYDIFNNFKTITTFNAKLNYLVNDNKTGLGSLKPETPLQNNITNNRDYKAIVDIVAEQLGTTMESVSYEADKMYYSYVIPSYLGNLILKLSQNHLTDEEYNNFIEDEYLRYRWFQQTDNEGNRGKIMCYWLDRIVNNKELRQNLQHVTSLHYKKVNYTDKTPSSYIASMIKMYLYDDNKKWAYYRVPMMSNKPSEEYIKFERISINYKNKILNELINTFYQEISRIAMVNDRKAKGIKGKVYDKSGSKFCYLDFLNIYLSPVGSIEYTDEEKQFITLLDKKLNNRLNNEYADIDNLNRLFVKIAEKHINNHYQEARKQWLDEGFLTKKGDKFTNEINATEEQLEEFYWNDMFAAINILQLTVTDIAQYKTAENLQKRLAQLHAPGMRANIYAKDSNGRLYSDGKHRTITIADNIVKSTIITNLRHSFDNILNNTDNEVEKRRLERQFKSILHSLQEINFADAQGFTCPTAYRKKLGIFGKWPSKDERAYNAIKKVMRGEKLGKNETLSHYIDVLWQPLKPFVYTQVGKETGSVQIPMMKEGRQIKDSEFCLILIDALTSGQTNNKSVLNAIFEFMEETQNDKNNIPTGKGIDTIIFESASKAETPNILDLNNLNYTEALEKLRSIQNNAAYVDEMDFRDYSIQQEIPEHFKDHKQAHGSQDRILTWTDIENKDKNGKDNTITIEIDGKPTIITVEAAKNIYFNAIADNINMSANELIKRFNLADNTNNKENSTSYISNNPKLRNIALSRMLTDNIRKDARFGADLLWACSVNKDGEFNIPLSDPIQSNRIQQLLNSIIKNQINKQEIDGGPVVQVSSWGKSDKLHIRFKNKEGKILLTEEEFNNGIKPNGYDTKFKSKRGYKTYKDYIQDQDSVAYYECMIPIQDSSLIDDFMDNNGNIDINAIEKTNPKLLEMIGYRIPTESKYSMVPMKVIGFLPINSGEGIMLPAEITWQSGSDFDIDKLYIMRYALDRVMENGKPKYISPEKGTREYNNNIIVNSQFSVLTSNLVFTSFFTPGNFDEPKHFGYLINYVQNNARNNVEEVYNEANNWSNDELKDRNKTAKNLIFNETQVQFHKQNMTAGKLIGIFAQANVSHGFISLEKGCSMLIQIMDAFTIDNHTIEGEVNIDSIKAFDGKNISNNLAALLAASVDAVKDPILNLMNINQTTANVVTAMLRIGFNLETVALLCSQPVIKEVVKNYNIEHSNKPNATLSSEIEKISKKLEKNLSANKQFNPEDIKIQTTTKALISNLKGNNDLTSWMALQIFDNMQSISNTFSNITHMTRYNSITSAVGPFASDTIILRLKDDAFYKDDRLVGSPVINAVENPILKTFRDRAFGIERQLLGKNIIQASPTFMNALITLSNILGYKAPSNKLANKLSDFMMSCFVAVKGDIFDLSKENREYMLTKFPADFNAIRNKYNNNIFVNSIQYTTSTTEQYPYLNIDTMGRNVENLEDLKQAWTELYKGDDKTKSLALRLVEYAFFKGGFGFNPKTFMKLVPNAIKLELKGYIDSLNIGDTSILKENTLNIIKLFLLHNTSYIPKYDRLDTFEYEPIANEENTFIVIKPEGQFVINYPLIRLGNEIYEVVSDRSHDMTIRKINSLGGNGQGFEISKDFNIPESIYKQEDFEENLTEEELDIRKYRKYTVEDFAHAMENLYSVNELNNIISDNSSIENTENIFNDINAKLVERQSSKLPNTGSIIYRIQQSILYLKSDLNRTNVQQTINDLNLCK